MSAEPIPRASARAIASAGTVSRAVSIGLAFCIGGCAVGPDFHRPSTRTPDRYNEVAPVTDTVSSKVPGGEAQHLLVGRDIPAEWWTLFRSPAITVLVATALRDSPTIEAANAALRVAQEQELSQQGTLFPTITGNISRSRQELPLSYEGGGQTPPLLFSDYGAHLNLSYTLDFWGGLRRAIEQTGAQVAYQRYQLEAAYLGLSAGVANTAILAASLAGQIEVQRQLIGFEQKQLDTVRQQFELGGATGTDVATQQAQVAQAQTVLVPLLTSLVQARDQLAAYVGQAPSDVVIPALTLDGLTLPTDIPVSVPSALLSQRPDIRAAEANLHQQMAALGVAIAQRLPNVTLTASVGSDAADTHQLFSPTNGMWSLVNQAVQPIFDAGQLLHKQRAQKAAMQQAAAQWRDTVVRAFQNVADVLAAVQNDAIGLNYALTAQQAASRGLSLATLQYKLGGVSYLSVLNAQQIYQNTVITLIRARAARFTDTVALFQALGGGWWNRNDMPPPPPGLFSSPLP
ncbi:efflux transporter outer membrane subunit [Lichenicola cladoniae]|uniref:Efflux transporter outer membrane subunit n=1 Tax=Lichenicola cladoniae TaxID=1484109 RepID=A0A6M8HQT2_9PROT|nr:efflux transporter outer membrane subunit [Lichenicola cladoniae]NPD68142.1 efflux transporter outer membrane subunit [Acetobacteraceae bacterium]QKE90712.1 efflux transporter outer membrane subunit [Lichenicola cladoniae]